MVTDARRGEFWAREMWETQRIQDSEAGHSGRLATIIIVPYRSSAKKKLFLLQTLEPEKVSGS